MKEKNENKKRRVAILSIVLCMAMVIGGTIAWLTDKTEDITNTFTLGVVDISLEETTGTTFTRGSQSIDNTYNMIPGNEMAKDPTAYVETSSDACYLYVKVTPSGGDVTVSGDAKTYDDYIEWEIADGWTALEGVDGVYWQKVDRDYGDSRQSFQILKGSTDNTTGAVYTKETVTNDMMKALMNADGTLNEEKLPKLTFTAYAIQQVKTTGAADGWTKLAAEM